MNFKFFILFYFRINGRILFKKGTRLYNMSKSSLQRRLLQIKPVESVSYNNYKAKFILDTELCPLLTITTVYK